MVLFSAAADLTIRHYFAANILILDLALTSGPKACSGTEAGCLWLEFSRRCRAVLYSGVSSLVARWA